MHRLGLCLVFIASTLAAPRPAAAAVFDTYDTIDSVEVNQQNCDTSFSGCPPTVTVRGIRAGQSAPSTGLYVFVLGNAPENLNTALHCQRLAILVMSKPGKFQFSIGHPVSPGTAGDCKLTAIAH